jgi:hypothetical protein
LHELADAGQVLLRCRRIPGEDGLADIPRSDAVLQEHVNGVTDLRRRQTGLTGNGVPRIRRTHTHDPLGVVPIRAAPEEGQGAIGKAAHVVERRLGDGREVGKPRRRRRQERNVVFREELELALTVRCRSLGRCDRRFAITIDADEKTGSVPYKLDGPLLGFVELPGVEPVQHPADRRLPIGPALRIDRARDDQAVDGAGHCDVVKAQPLRALLAATGLADGLVLERATASSGLRVGHAKAEAAIRQAEDLVR